MAENGSFKERWQYRQEMKAHGAWNHWGFPTRDDYAQFSDARNLADLVKTWRPHNLAAYGLGEQGLTPLLQAEKEEAYALLDKRMEEGLSEPELQKYAQLLNRWQAEHRMLAGEEMQMPAQRNTEEGHTHSISHTPDQARAWVREPDGVVIRDLRDRLDALMTPAEPQAVQQRPEDITERIAALLEEAQRQGLVVTGQETPQVQQKQRMGY